MANMEKVISTEGHLIDSGLMRQILDTVIADGGSYEILDFRIGRTNDEYSHAKLKIKAEDPTALNAILLKLSTLGCQIDKDEKVNLGEAPADGVVPPDFYSTTNHDTLVRVNGDWLPVENLRMDGVIVVDGKRAMVKKFRDVKKGDKVVLGIQGVKVQPEFVERDRADFSFMSGDVSTERKVRLFVDRVAEHLKDKSKRVVAVAGPVIVHTGGGVELARLIDHGFVHALLAGNALAVDDIESNLTEPRWVSTSAPGGRSRWAIGTIFGRSTKSVGQARWQIWWQRVRSAVVSCTPQSKRGFLSVWPGHYATMVRCRIP